MDQDSAFRVSAITNIQSGYMERSGIDIMPSTSKLQVKITVMVSAGGRTESRRKSKKLIPGLDLQIEGGKKAQLRDAAMASNLPVNVS